MCRDKELLRISTINGESVTMSKVGDRIEFAASLSIISSARSLRLTAARAH